MCVISFLFFFFQAEDGIRDHCVTGVQTCALPICPSPALGEIIRRALEKDRNLRYQSAADMRVELQRLRRDTATRHAIEVDEPESVAIPGEIPSATGKPRAAASFQPSGALVHPPIASKWHAM